MNPSSLSGFTYVQGSGPSTSQSFDVTGANLTGNLSVSSAGTDYVISASEGGTYGTSLTLTQSSGSVSATVYVKLSSGLAIGDYNDQDVAVSGGGATSQAVTCSGSVTSPPPPDAPLATAATNPGNTSFTANWNTVSGATGYRLDVYTKTAGGNATDLFFSEYVEPASGDNKGLEIFNGTGSAADLSDYQVHSYSNGSSTASYTLDLSGSLANGAVYRVVNSSQTIFGSNYDLSTNNQVMQFNGNDALVLYKESSSSNVDIFGELVKIQAPIGELLLLTPKM